MIRTLRKWVSTMLIAALCAGFIVVPEKDALAADRPKVDLVAVLVDASMLNDTTAVGVREDLKNEFPANMQNITLSERVKRYADDIQNKLAESKVLIIPVKPDEEPWRIQEALAKLYTEGDGSVNTATQLKGIVLIGNVPLPLVTKSGRSYVSMYPYTDFEDPEFTYDFNRQEFVPREVQGREQPEVWHGVIPYPISWEQYVRDQQREQELSKIRREQGVDAYTKRLEEMRVDYNKAQREELAHYLDKNHSFYTKGAYSLFSKKALIMDIFREFQTVTDFGLSGYSAYLENWDNKSYMRYTREWLDSLQKKYFSDATKQLDTVYGTNPDGSATTPQQFLDGAKKDIQNNPRLSDAEKERQIRELENSTQKAGSLEADIAQSKASSNVIPDIFTRDPIETFLQTSTEVFSAIVGAESSYFTNTGRWSFTGESGDRQGFTLYKIVEMLDENSRHDILEVNNALEKEVDTMLNDAAAKSLNMQLDIPAAPINYFGRYTSYLYQSPKEFLGWGDLFNAIGRGLDFPYVPGHYFYLDLSPTPPREGIPIQTDFDAVSFLTEAEKPENAKKYIPYTGQQYTKIDHHMQVQKQSDVALIEQCGNWARLKTWFVDIDKQCTLLYDNPSPAQIKYVELYDPTSATLPAGQREQVEHYQTAQKLYDYIDSTLKPDLNYVGQEIYKIGDLPLMSDYGKFIAFTKPLDLKGFLPRLKQHVDHLSYWNGELIKFQVIVHVVDLPFSAEQCTIYMGGAPETATVGDQQYPIYLRGREAATPETAARKEANSWDSGSGNVNLTGLDNTASWRTEKVNTQVTLSVASEQKRIRSKDMDIKVREDACGRMKDEAAKACWEDVALKKIELDQMNRLLEQAKVYYGKIWSAYYGAMEGDTGRFGAYLEHVATLEGQASLAKTVEANHLYDQGQNANLRLDNAADDSSKQRLDAAAGFDPTWFGYQDLRLDQRPASFNFPDWFDLYRNGYWGGCAAPNLRRVEDTANKVALTPLRQQMETSFQKLRDKHIADMDGKDKLQFLKIATSFFFPPLAVDLGLASLIQTADYFQAVALYSDELFRQLETMISTESYQPSAESQDAIEASVAAYKSLLQVEKENLTRDISEQEYNDMKPDLRAITNHGVHELTIIEKAYIDVMAKNPDDRKNNPTKVTLDPHRDFGLEAPVEDFFISDSTTRDAAKTALYDLVQGQYELRLMRNPKITPVTLQGLQDMGGRAVETANATLAAMQGEIDAILNTGSIIEALKLVGVTCDPQRAMEPIQDVAGAKALTDPGYIPLRTTDRTVKITDANTLAPTILQGNEQWVIPGKSPLVDPPKETKTYAPPQAQTMGDAAPTWKEPVLKQQNDERPTGNPLVQQTYSDDYPKTRSETLYDPSQIANSYEQGWEYTRKGFVVTEDQPASLANPKPLNQQGSTPLSPETSYLACLRYAKYGMDPNVMKAGTPSDAEKKQAPYYGNNYADSSKVTPTAKDAVSSTSSAETIPKLSGWTLVNKLFQGGANAVNFTMLGRDATEDDKNVLLQYLKDFERMANSEKGNWHVFPDSKDDLLVKMLLPLEYTGKWDYQFKYIMQLPNALEAYWAKAMKGTNIDVNDPQARQQLYSVYGVRRVETVIPHKEPTNETIARQLQSMTATSLPVNNPRYVDFYLYEPIPVLNPFGEVLSWKEYDEHVSIPYVNLFRAFPDEKRFSYVMDKNHQQFKADMVSVQERIDGIMNGFNNYLQDYVGKTSMSGPKATIDSTTVTVDTTSIGDSKVRDDMNQIIANVGQQLGQGKTPQELQNLLQQNLGGQQQSDVLKATNLEDISFDTNRFNRVISATSLGDGTSDRTLTAKKKLAFAVYWQHMTLAEKYKYVMHNYLASSPDPDTIDMDFWKQATDYTAADGNPQTKVGFEAATIILESPTASKMQIPLEQIQSAKKTTGAFTLEAVPTQQVTVPELQGNCDQRYKELGGSKYGVSIENWGPAIACWATHLWPLQDVADPGGMDFTQWTKQAENEGKNFAADTGRFVDDLGKVKDAVVSGASAVWEGGGAVLDSTGKWLNDLDQDGLSTAFAPQDPNPYSADDINSKGERGKPNGFKDGQDYVSSLRLYASNEKIQISQSSNSVVSIPAEQKGGVIPYGSGNPLEVKVALLTKDKEVLTANNFDYVRLEVLPDGDPDVITLAASEQVQRVSEGVATFRVYASSATNSFGTAKVKATLLRQKLPNSSYEPNPTDITADFAITVTPELLTGVLHRIPCSPAERDAGRCARGDVRSAQVDSIFSTNETAQLLSLVATDKSKPDTVVNRSGKATVRYYKDAVDPKNLYKKAMGGRDSLQIQLTGGTYEAAYAVPKESGKYFIEIVPEEALNMAPLVMSFLVVDTTYTTMRLLTTPSVAIEGQKVTLHPSFTNFSGEEVDLGLAQASVGIPTKTPAPLDIKGLKIFDGMPGGDTEDFQSIDIAAGKVKELSLTIPDSAGSQKEPYTMDFVLSKISPLSQIQAQAGSLDAAIAQGLAVKMPLMVYPKGSLEVRAALTDGSKTVSVPVLTASETQCIESKEASAARAFSINIEIRDKNGRGVPYTGELTVVPQDFGLFTGLPSTVSLVEGKGTLTVTPSRKAGKTTLQFKDAEGAFTAATINVNVTPGPLAALQFSTKVTRPLEAESEQNDTPTPDTLLPLRYVGLDICGNPVDDTDTTAIALDIQPPLGDGKQLELLPIDTAATGQVGRADVSEGTTSVTMATQRLAAGRNTVALRAVNFRGEASITLRALTTDGNGKTVVNQRVTPDTVTVPVRLTLRKELLQSLEPNILYTNLLGGPYGDVTQKDFLGAWWMLTGKTQVVTTSTVAAETPANLAKVLPNGAIDMGKRNGNSLGVQMFAEPKLEPNMPFTVEVKDQSDGAAVMQVRYNIVPFISGALFENYSTDITTDQTAALAPGIYVVPATGVTTRKDLLQQNRSVVRFFAADKTGVQREAAILADNLQFFPGGGTTAQPFVAMNTERLDIMTLALQDSNKKPLATVYVKLDPQRVFPAEGDYARDVQLSLDAVRADAVSGGSANSTATGIQLSDEVTKRIAEAEKKAPLLAGAASAGLRYVRQELDRVESLDGIKNGIFTRSVADKLLKVVDRAEATGLYVGDKLVFPLRNLAQTIPAVQAWLGANTLKYQLELAEEGMKVHVRYAANSGATLDMLTLQPVYGTAPLSWEQGQTANKTAWYLTATQAAPYTYTTDDKGLRVMAAKREDVPGAPVAAAGCAPVDATNNLPAAGILPTGEAFTCFDSLVWERSLVTAGGRQQIHYSLKEQGTTGTRLLTEAYLNIAGERAFRTLANTRGSQDLFSSTHQGVYITLEDDTHLWNAEGGQIVRKNPLPGATTGLVPVLSLTPAEFLNIPASVASSGLYRTRLDTTQSIPTVVLDESRDGTWKAVVTLRLQMQEVAAKVRPVATANADTERASEDTDILRLFMTDTSLVEHEEGNVVRVTQGNSTADIVRMSTAPLNILALGAGVVPELLDISGDRFQVRLKNVAGAELMNIEARYNPTYTRLLTLAKDTTLPSTLRLVPGMYIQQNTPLLRMVHSADRTLSSLMLGFEEVMTIGKTGGQRVLRPDLLSIAYKPDLASGQFISFSLQLFGVEGMIVHYGLSSLPFDLRVLTYIHEQNKPALETEEKDQNASILRPRTVTSATDYLALVGHFLDLTKVQESLTERNSQFVNTTVSLVVRATEAGYLAATLNFAKRDKTQNRDGARLTFVPMATAQSVQDLPRNQANAVSLNGLAILRDADKFEDACVRLDTRNGVQLLTCRDGRGVGIFKRSGTTTTPVAMIRNDGAYLVQDPAYDLRLRLDAGSLIHIFYSLTEKGSNATVLEDVVMGGSTTLSSHVRRGAPDADQQALAGTYVAYIATPSSGQATYTLMQDISGVANSGNNLEYCTDKNDLARTCQNQLSFGPSSYLQRPDDRFIWVQETAMKDAEGYAFPAFGYEFQPASTRIATLALLLQETPLTAVNAAGRGNIALTAQGGAEAVAQDGQLLLKQGGQTLFTIEVARGRVVTNLEMRALSFTPTQVRLALFSNTTQLGELRINRSYVANNALTTDADPVNPSAAGMYLSNAQNLLQVLHDFPAQSTQVQLGYDRLMTLAPDGRVDIAIPSMVRTLLPEGEQNPLRLTVNRPDATLMLGTSLVAFPLDAITDKLQALSQQLASSSLQTLPLMKTTVDSFGNLVTEALIQRKSTSDQQTAAQLRPVFAPTRPQIVYTATPQTPASASLPSFQLNPATFYNAIRNETYTVTDADGDLYFHAASANPYWTSSFGRDPACTETEGPALVAVLQHDGTRVLCDPLHTMDLSFDNTNKLFVMTLRTLQTQPGVSSTIGSVFITPGDLARYRILTGENNFNPNDVATNFSLQGLYAAVNSDYELTPASMLLKLTKGDKAPVWSATTKDFMTIMTSGRVWNNSADRFYVSFENAADSSIALTQRRLPLAWKVMERREVRFTDQGTEPWSGDLVAASMRMTLTDPAVTTLASGGTPAETTPSFVCAPAKPEVTCTVDAEGMIRLDEIQNNATITTNADVSSIPALVFRKDMPSRWLETGLWNGSTRFDAGDKTGVARLELYGADGQIRAVMQYRPALQIGRPRVNVYPSGSNTPALSTTQPEVQILLANAGVHVIEKTDFFMVTVDQTVQTEGNLLFALSNNGSVAALVRRLQNLDALSFDGTTARLMGTVGQYGFSLEVTRDRLHWTIGDITALLPAQTSWKVRPFEEVQQQAAYALAKGQTVVDALRSTITFATTAEGVTVQHTPEGGTPTAIATIPQSASLAAKTLSEEVMAVTRTTASADELLLVDKQPSLALVHIVGNPRIAGSATAVAEDPFVEVNLVPAGNPAPNIDRPGTAYIQTNTTDIRLMEEDQQILVDRRDGTSWQRLAAVSKRTLAVTLVDTNRQLLWQRGSTTLTESFIQDIDASALVRVRRQSQLPDLVKTSVAIADFPRNATSPVTVEQRDANAERTLAAAATAKAVLFGNQLQSAAGNGLRLQPADTGTLAPALDITRQDRSNTIMRVQTDRLLISSLDTLRYQVVPQTVMPTLQRYTIYPVGPIENATALATITRSQPYAERYTPARWISADTNLSNVSAPGMLVREVQSLVTMEVDTTTNTTKVRYGYDLVGTINGAGEIAPISTGWQALMETARSLRSSLEGTIVQLFDVPYIRYVARRNTQGYTNDGIRNTIFVEARSMLGSTPITLVNGADRPTQLKLGNPALTWNQEMVATALSSLVRYTYETAETSVLKFNISTATGPLASLFIQTVADPSAADGSNTNGNQPENLGSTPVDQVTQALDILGGTGIYVQIRSPEKGLLSLAYEPAGDSTNNLYAVALRDASLPLQQQDQINPQTVGVEDALESDADGLGYKGDYKNMLLFAAGNSVGESTLPYMSEALINLGDPVISLTVEDADRSNESFTDDVGTLIYSHTGGTIQQMVLYDIDQDGKEDIVFTDGDGILQVIRNEGGTPIKWNYLGGSFEIPEGIRELLIMQLQEKKNLAVVVGTPAQSPSRTTKDAVTAVDGALDQSFVELRNTAGQIERCNTAVPGLGKLQTALFGDIDGDGTDDLVALTNKNEIKSVHIDPSVDCGVTDQNKQRYTVSTVDTIGMRLDGTPLATPTHNVPQGFNILPQGDVYARFNGPYVETWNPLQSICPKMDPSVATPVYPRSQTPTTMPANPDLVFIPEPPAPTTGAANIGSDPVSQAAGTLRDTLPGSEGVYFSYQGNGEQLMRMLVSGELPYIRSGGKSLTRYNEAFQALAQTNPFSCLAGGYGGVGSFLTNVAGQAQQFLGFLSGPVKAAQSQTEETQANTPSISFNIEKYAKDINGGIIQEGDTLAYAITLTNNLPGGATKNVDIGDRFQQGTDLLTGSVTCQRGDTRFTCTPQDGGGLFGLYIPSIEVPGGQTVTVFYQVKVSASPLPLTLDLLDGPSLTKALSSMNFSLVGFVNPVLNLVDTSEDPLQKAFNAALAQSLGFKNIDKQKIISVSTPAMADNGAFLYWQKTDNTFGAKVLKKPPTQSPIMRIPVLGKILESLGLVWTDDGELDPTAKANLSSDNVQKSTKSINNLLTNAFLASDRDMDGLVDLWDEDVQAPTIDVGNVGLYAKNHTAIDMTVDGIGAINNGAQDLAASAGKTLNKVEKSLTAVNKELQNLDCNEGGCSLIPADWNTAFFAPGTDSIDKDALKAFGAAPDIGGSLIKKTIKKVADQTAYAVLAAPTPEPPTFFWPPSLNYDSVKTVSQFRLYLSVTLTGRFAMTACVGPYHVGMVYQPTPTGFELIKNCYSYLLPDILNIKEFCRDIADGLSGFVGGLGRIISTGGYSIARVKKAGSIAGLAAQEQSSAFVADQFVFETTRFKNPTGENVAINDAVGNAVGKFLKDFRQLGRGTGQVTASPNKRMPGFPAFVMDWLERQIHEVLAKLLKLPTITLIYPDPRIGFTMPANVANDTLEKRQKNGDTTAMDTLQQRVTDLSCAYKTEAELRASPDCAYRVQNGVATVGTESDQAAEKQRASEALQLKTACEKANPNDHAICGDPARLNDQLAQLDAAAGLNLDVLPDDDGLLSISQQNTAFDRISQDLQQAKDLAATIPNAKESIRTQLQKDIQTLQAEYDNPSDTSKLVDMLTRGRKLLNDVKLQLSPDFANNQLRSYNQLLQTKSERTVLANCNPDDPVGCALKNADQSYRQFMDGVSLDNGQSISSVTALADAGVSSDQLLKKNVRGFSEVLGIITSLPFVTVRLRDVVFYYPWLPPDRISEFLYQLEGVQNQSLENFSHFMDRWAYCFYEPDSNGNVNWNHALPIDGAFTVRDTLQADLAHNATAGAGANVTVQSCLAAARVASDAHAGLQGIENNINQLKGYGNVLNSMKQYLQWKTYIVGRVLGLVSGLINQIVSYVNDQNSILANWRDTIRSIGYAVQTFQVLVDVFDTYQRQCAGCQNQRGTDEASFMDLVGNFIQLQVVPFPKWPDVEIDLSNINLRYEVVIPNIRLIPQQINLPRFTPITLPQLDALPQADLNLVAKQGLNITMPILPSLPTLPQLPELPSFRFPKFPDLPPPPKIPQLNLQIRQMVRIIGQMLNIVCLVQRNILPIAESRVRSHIASLTTSPSVLRTGQTVTTPTYEPTLDRIRLSTQVNITFDTNRPFGKDTYIAVFDQAAKWWNGFVRDFLVNPTNYGLRDIPQKIYGDAVNFVTQEVTQKAVDDINKKLSDGGKALNDTLKENISVPVTNFQQDVQAAVQKKQEELQSRQVSVAPSAEEERKAQLVAVADGDPLSLYLIDQMLALESMVVQGANQSGAATSDSYIPELERQIALLKSDDSGLPEHMRDKAVERLQSVVTLAKRPAPSVEKPLDVESLPYVSGWRDLEQELTKEQQSLSVSERTLARLDTAKTLEEFKSVLADAGMLAEGSYADKPVASLGQQDSVNTDSQRELDTMSAQVAREVPMDGRGATFEKSIIRETTQIADAPEVGANGAAVASNVGPDGAPLLAAATTAPAVTQSNTATPPPDKKVAIGSEEEGAIIVELPNNGGLVTLMHYIPADGLPVQLALSPLHGDKDHPDAVVSIGGDIYFKENLYNRTLKQREAAKTRYTGSDRVRVLNSINDILPVLPAVQGAAVTSVSAQSVQIRFDLPARTRQVDAKGAFIGEDARYVLRAYSRLLGKEQGETPMEYVILPVPAEAVASNQARLAEILQQNTEAMPAAVRDKLAQEATRQGLTTDRVLLGIVDGRTVNVTLPVQGRETPIFMTVVPRVQTENGDRLGLASPQIFAHPQRAQDTTPPIITVQGGNNQVVPLETPLELHAVATDAINDVVSVSWDTDLLKDSDLDGDTANDQDIVCGTTTPCTLPLVTMNAQTRNKGTTPSLNAPTLTKTWLPGDTGMHQVRAFAKDALGNVATQDVTLQVIPTEIRIDEYNQQSGTVRGTVYPPQANKTLQLLRMRDNSVSELHLPDKVTTDANGHFVIQGVTSGQGTAVYDGSGKLMPEQPK